MRILDVHPCKGMHRPGEPVHLRVVTAAAGGTLRATVSNGTREVAVLEQPVTARTTILTWQPPGAAPRGYGIDVALVDGDGTVQGTASSAFDVLDHWTQHPRYGFLSDFAPDRADLGEALDHLARHHVNGLQLYDWQYRHDQLVAPTQVYNDPLGRTLSLDTIRAAIGGAHERGMAAMAYMAIYAASTGFWREHPEWAMYDLDGGPLTFEDFLGLMDPSAGRPWAEHLLEQCARTIAAGFDGIHVDQYGEPREATDAHGEPIDLPAAFGEFVADLKRGIHGAPVTMNAVKNWPIDALTASPQDFAYIEVWPDTPTYRELADIVLAARAAAGTPVVVAVYLPADRPANVLTADGLLLAAGATRIELGEGRRLLTDPYFPNHSAVPDDLEADLRLFHDLVVRHGDLVGPAVPVAELPVQVPSGVWALPRRRGALESVALVNMTGLEEARWDEAHPEPAPRQDVRLTLGSTATAAWWASPEAPAPVPLPLEQDGDGLHVSVPTLHRWGLVHLHDDQERRP